MPFYENTIVLSMTHRLLPIDYTTYIWQTVFDLVQEKKKRFWIWIKNHNGRTPVTNATDENVFQINNSQTQVSSFVVISPSSFRMRIIWYIKTIEKQTSFKSFIIQSNEKMEFPTRSQKRYILTKKKRRRKNSNRQSLRRNVSDCFCFIISFVWKLNKYFSFAHFIFIFIFFSHSSLVPFSPH